MKSKLLVFLFLLTSLLYAQDKPIPVGIVPSNFLNFEAYKIIRWTAWSDKQKTNIHAKYLELNTQAEKDFEVKKEEMLQTIKGQLTEVQKEDIVKKEALAGQLQTEINQSLENFFKKIPELNGKVQINENFYHQLISQKQLYYPEIWALTHMKLENKEEEELILWVLDLKRQESGFHFASQIKASDFDKNSTLFNAHLKKDYGSALLKEKLLQLVGEKRFQEYNSLKNHYDAQKDSLHQIYAKYAKSLSFTYDLRIPKIMDMPSTE